MQVLTKNGFQNFDSIKDQGLSRCLLEIVFDDDTTFKCTHDHLLLVEDEFVAAIFLEVGDFIDHREITDISEIANEVVYDLLDVENGNHDLTNGVTSHNCNIVFLDEFAFVQRAEEFYTSTYPVISSGKTTKVIVTSTANGIGNPFYKIWEGAVQGSNDFKPFRVDWWDVPGRSEKWKKQTIANTSKLQFEQEYGNCLESNSEIDILINNANEVYTIKIGDLHNCLQRKGTCGLSLNEDIRLTAVRRNYSAEALL